MIVPADSLAARVRERRKARGLTQKKLAELCGTEPDNIAKIERGKSKNPGIIEALADALGTTPGYLKFGEPSAPGPSDALDKTALQIIIEAVEEVFERDGLSLPPHKKARLIAALYDLSVESGKSPSRHVIRDFVMMIA